MQLATITDSATVVLISLAVALLALIFMSRRFGTGSHRTDAAWEDVAFLIDGDTVIDATDPGWRLLKTAPAGTHDLARITLLLTPRFPDLPRALDHLDHSEAVELASPDGLSRLHLGQADGRLRISVTGPPHGTAQGDDGQTVLALSEELATYRALETGMPVPVWRQTVDGQVTWANSAYRQVAAALGKEGGDALHKVFNLAGRLTAGEAQRVQIDLPDAKDSTVSRPAWYDCQGAAVGSDFVFTAISADPVVSAQRTLREFVQTLTQTFAHLSVGLAIFDKSRVLTLFNPALSDLLGLTPEYLITRPSLTQMLDLLRDRNMMPEPKNYKSWRQQMSDLEAAAVDGSYSETWSLADGRTFRVTGRPHPDGAVAFLFEDISAEISLSRSFRTELEMGQAVIDSLDEAIAVFSPAGYLITSNRAYGDLWHTDPSTSLGEVSFLDATRSWQAFCAPTPIWGDARDFAATFGERSNWTAEVRLTDGRLLACRFEALPGGVTLVGFSETAGLSSAPVADTARRVG